MIMSGPVSDLLPYESAIDPMRLGANNHKIKVLSGGLLV